MKELARRLPESLTCDRKEHTARSRTCKLRALIASRAYFKAKFVAVSYGASFSWVEKKRIRARTRTRTRNRIEIEIESHPRGEAATGAFRGAHS